VHREVNFVDIYAERGEERLCAEAKGRTTSPGGRRYALWTATTTNDRSCTRSPVCRGGANSRVECGLRVPVWVRERLSIDVYEVDDDAWRSPAQISNAPARSAASQDSRDRTLWAAVILLRVMGWAVAGDLF
jgi:hypothetical protein